jgi:sugar lactone lactonase YvrE
VTHSNKLPDFAGALMQNDRLSASEVLFENGVEGPESIAEVNGVFYSGTTGGGIISWKKGDKQVKILVKHILGQECDLSKSHRHQKKCGRVLGMRSDSKGNLYALDAFTGIYKIDVKTGKVIPVWTVVPGKVIGSRDITFLDDIALHEGGGKKGGNVFYITDSTKDLTLDECFVSIITAEKSGRVLRFDEDSKDLTVVYEGLHFPNGIELTDDKSSVLINEISVRTLTKIGIKDGSKVILNDNLPGMADNIRRSTRKDKETYWLAFFQAKTEVDIVDNLRRTPFFLKAILRLTNNIGVILDKLGCLIDCAWFRDIAYLFKSQMVLLLSLYPKTQGLVIEVDSKGQVLRSLWDPTAKFTYLSEVHETVEGNEKVLYLASFTNKYAGRVVLSEDIVPSALKPQTSTQVPSTTAKQVTPSSTTTTPKPTTKKTVPTIETRATPQRADKQEL